MEPQKPTNSNPVRPIASRGLPSPTPSLAPDHILSPLLNLFESTEDLFRQQRGGAVAVVLQAGFLAPAAEHCVAVARRAHSTSAPEVHQAAPPSPALLALTGLEEVTLINLAKHRKITLSPGPAHGPQSDWQGLRDRLPSQLGWSGRGSHLLTLPGRLFGVAGSGQFLVSLRVQTREARIVALLSGYLERHRTPSAADHVLRSEVAEPPMEALLPPLISPAMDQVLRTLQVFAPMAEIVLLRGATGTGKTTLARWIHNWSRRSDGPFQVADLLGVPETGHESALFGVARESFTGVRAQIGLVEAAEAGTLFIDELDKLSLAAQSRLLRLIDRKEYSVLGQTATRVANVRILVASNANLEQAVARGALLEDLFHRVNVLTVQIPPLEQRREEIGPWVARWLSACAETARPASATPEAIRLLCAQSWPGNLRQLHNVTRRAYAFALRDAPPQGDVTLGHACVLEALAAEPSPSPQRPLSSPPPCASRPCRPQGRSALRVRPRRRPVPAARVCGWPPELLSRAARAPGGRRGREARRAALCPLAGGRAHR